MDHRLMDKWIPTAEETEGRYGIPKIAAAEMPEIDTWLPFSNLSAGITEKTGLSMYVDDYRIDRLWKQPDRYLLILNKAGVVLTPDYSVYTDVPEAVSIYNHFRKHWLGAYWQRSGLVVIPTICWAGEDSFRWCFDGTPKNATVSVSSVGTQRRADTKLAFLRGYDAMMERLTPSCILFFGSVPKECKGNILPVEAYYEQVKRRCRDAKA